MTTNSPGIYSIRNTVTDKQYIGQTTNLRTRLLSHKSTLNKRKHHCKHLQLAFNKYGIHAFRFEVLEVCSRDKLDIREQFWIKLWESTNPKKGYNTECGGLTRPLANSTTIKRMQIAQNIRRNRNQPDAIDVPDIPLPSLRCIQ